MPTAGGPENDISVIWQAWGSYRKLCLFRACPYFVSLIAHAMRPRLDDANLLVESSRRRRALVSRLAMGGDPIPMTLDHLGELPVRHNALPLQAGLSLVK
jgi:hypothetical protein